MLFKKLGVKKRKKERNLKTSLTLSEKYQLFPAYVCPMSYLDWMNILKWKNRLQNATSFYFRKFLCLLSLVSSAVDHLRGNSTRGFRKSDGMDTTPAVS